jgi:hypothetical protein
MQQPVYLFSSKPQFFQQQLVQLQVIIAQPFQQLFALVFASKPHRRQVGQLLLLPQTFVFPVVISSFL